MAIRIIAGGLDDPRVIALLELHVATSAANTASGSAHALDVERLKAPGMHFWSAWQDDALLGTSALKMLGEGHGEIKSMHVAQSARRQGIGAALLRHVVAEARAMGLTRLSLESGSWPYFLPAHALYRAHGFTVCAPFADYRPDRNSLFLTLPL